MTIGAIVAKPYALAQAESSISLKSTKRNSEVEKVPSIFQGEIIRNISASISMDFGKKFPGDSSELKILSLVSPAGAKKSEKTGHKQTGFVQEDSQKNSEVTSVENKPPDDKAQFVNMAYGLLNNMPAAGLIENPVFQNVVSPTLADEINFLVDEIVGQIKLAKLGGLTKIDLYLQKESFGNLKISISFKDNKLNIEMFMNPEVKALLEPYFSGLIEKLAQANIEVGGLNVTVKQDYRDNGLSQESEKFSEGEKISFEGSSSVTSGESSGPDFLKAWARSLFASQKSSGALVEIFV